MMVMKEFGNNQFSFVKMKKIKNAYIWCISLMMICMTACSDRDNETPGNINPEEGLPITATLDTRAIPDELTCMLYVFWKPTSTSNYVYKEEVGLTNPMLPYQMQFLSDDLIGKSYRFLFVASPTTNSKISVSNDGNGPLGDGNTWDQVLISSSEQLLEDKYYYAVLDMSGNDILQAGAINANLERMVGQIVLDIFRINGNISAPENIQSNLVASVLDRVYEVDIEYSNLTKEFTFNETGTMVEKSSWPTALTQTLNATLGDTLQVYLPQLENGFGESIVEVKGGAQIKGNYCLSSSAKIRTKYTFKYYDTTPTCANAEKGHKHTFPCFENNKRELVLYIPQRGDEGKLLNVLPNHFTVSKAGIRYDRIIDLASATSFELATAWNNENIENE